ncbi:hypothetical protein JS533_001570 [Bifidobacterium amazonense]|uniref:Uncharacterized protein n=1 Tax=Bifidobacterium amazonense TaxID=2809027 RepID=A0ABS9VSC2_9BIFI|nr:hypothetical protein [Bifidobacterium amazonense]MCH9274978.1 hypothetical protein [Bifidobacterium amazonense]
MKCWLKHEWPDLCLALLWLGLVIVDMVVGAPRLMFLLCGFMLAWSVSSATLGHLLWHAEREIDDLRERHVDALVTAFMFHPLEHELTRDGDKALITLEHRDGGRRSYDVEIIPGVDGEVA